MKAFLIRMAFNATMRKKVWARIAMQLKYKVPLITIFKNLREQYSNNSLLYELFDDVYTKYQEAKSLSIAFDKYCPYDEIMLIESCESSGKLHEGFELAERIVIAKTNINKSVKSALAYPSFLFLLLIAIVLTASLVLIPALEGISNPANWKGLGYVLYLIASFVGSIYGVIFGVFLLLALVFLFYCFPNYTGDFRVKLDRFPPFSIYRLIVGSTWLFTFSSLMKAGKQQIDILKDMANSNVSTPYLKSRIQLIIDNFSGKKFGDALILADTGFPDEELINDLNVYSELPEFESKLYQLADDWIKINEEKMKDNAKVFQTVCLVFITFIIIGIILAYNEISMSFGV